jgi:hypothetical protein
VYLVNKKVDYLSVTVDKTDHRIVGEIVEEMDYSPLRNYDKAFVTENQARIFKSSNNKNMGTHIVMSGACLDILRGEGHSDTELARYFMEYEGCKISRCDVCVTSERRDGKKHNLSPHYLAMLSKSGELKSRQSPDNGVINPEMYIETHYIGSRKSRNRLFKAYDKGVDLGLHSRRLIRYEMEVRKQANVTLNAVSQGIDIGSIIRRYYDYPSVSLWGEIMGAESVSMPHIEDKTTIDDKKKNEDASRWHWLFTSVAPAMAKALISDNVSIEENENLRLWGIHVQQLYEDLKNE